MTEFDPQGAQRVVILDLTYLPIKNRPGTGCLDSFMAGECVACGPALALKSEDVREQ